MKIGILFLTPKGKEMIGIVTRLPVYLTLVKKLVQFAVLVVCDEVKITGGIQGLIGTAQVKSMKEAAAMVVRMIECALTQIKLFVAFIVRMVSSFSK